MSIPYGYVYRIRNKINGKTYVGQRKLSLDKQWRQYMGSGVAIKAAIAKYGIDSFTKELLTYASSYDELNKIEVDLIIQERNTGKAEYNLHIGSPVPKDARACKNMSAEEKEAVYQALAEKTKEWNRLKYESVINIHKESILSLYGEYKNCDKVANQLQISRTYVIRFLKEIGVQLNHQNVTGRILDDNARNRISEGLKNSSVRFQLVCNSCGSTFESKSFTRKKCLKCPPESVSSQRKKKSVSSKIVTICRICNEEFERELNRKAKFCSKKCSTEASKKELPSIDVIEQLYWKENLSANEIGARYSTSGQTIRNYMRKNGLNRREERRHA